MKGREERKGHKLVVTGVSSTTIENHVKSRERRKSEGARGVSYWRVERGETFVRNRVESVCKRSREKVNVCVSPSSPALTDARSAIPVRTTSPPRSS